MLRTNLRLIALGASFGVLAAFIVALPMAWVVPIVLRPSPGFDWQTARGSVWNGAIEKVRTPFGILDQITIHPAHGLALFSATPLRVGVHSAGLEANGWVGTKRLRQMHLEAQLVSLAFSDARLQGVLGTLKVDLEDLRYSRQACEYAKGNVWTDVLRRNANTWNWSGPDLSGTVLCDAGDLVLELNGEDSNQRIKAVLKLRFKGNYRAEVTVFTREPSAQTLLPLLGFAKHEDSFTLVEEGRWSWQETQ